MKVVFWDWNGTLVNDAPVVCDVFNAIVEPRGCTPVTLDQYRELYRHPIRSMYEDVGFDFDRHPFEEVARVWHDEYEARVPTIALHHDVHVALETMKRRGSRQFVLSALPHNLLVASVDTHGVGHFFEEVCGISDNLGEGKVEEGRGLLRRLGVPGSDVTIIGDSSHDAEVARSLDAKCILVARGSESRRRLEMNGFPVVESFASIIGIE
jgi:phosphoglycolate phosphatase